ncbi:MAG: hypothetical protein JXB34_13590 [Bacteroidales bacterium]|nr:hypothetical protein [Bacteroidales bacterium]
MKIKGVFTRYIELIKLLFASKEKRFTDIYLKDKWHSNESKSGKGSEIANTENVRAFLPEIVKTYSLKSLLDIPCGDFNWMKEVVSNFQTYTGGDIVDELILKNNDKYSNERIKFNKIDIVNDPIPPADLLLCRDLFIHLSFKDIRKVIDKVKKSNVKYLLASTYKIMSNKDIKTGLFRPVNLCLDPINLPEPLRIIFDGYGKPESPSGLKYLALWNIENLR